MVVVTTNVHAFRIRVKIYPGTKNINIYRKKTYWIFNPFSPSVRIAVNAIINFGVFFFLLIVIPHCTVLKSAKTVTKTKKNLFEYLNYV